MPELAVVEQKLESILETISNLARAEQERTLQQDLSAIRSVIENFAEFCRRLGGEPKTTLHPTGITAARLLLACSLPSSANLRVAVSKSSDRTVINIWRKEDFEIGNPPLATLVLPTTPGAHSTVHVFGEGSRIESFSATREIAEVKFYSNAAEIKLELAVTVYGGRVRIEDTVLSVRTVKV